MQRVASKMNPPPEIVTLNPTSLSEVMESITTVGNAIGHAEGAAKIRAQLEGRIQRCKDVAAEAKASQPDYKPKKVMFFEWTDPIYPAGHWTPEMIEIAGGVHPINAPGVPS